MTVLPPVGPPGPPGPPDRSLVYPADPADRPDDVAGARERPDEHLDELAAMRLADGESVDPPLARHARRCDLCATFVSALRDEGLFLNAALALDPSELTALAQAQLPAQVAALASAAPVAPPVLLPFPATQPIQRDGPATLVAMLITAFAGYIGWLLAQPMLAGALEIARSTGAATVATRWLAEWVFNLLWASLAFLDTVQSLHLLENPTLPLALLAVLAWLALAILPAPTTRVTATA
jgi:hypothetical protein